MGVCLIALTLLAGQATAPATPTPVPSFEGIWVLDAEASSLAPRDKVVLRIGQTDTELVIERQSRGANQTRVYRLDGQPFELIEDSRRLQLRAKWEKGRLVVVGGKRDPESPRITLSSYEETLEISTAGDTLTSVLVLRTPNREFKSTRVYRRQES